jgi:multiple sugar transport system ATP-binding protein
VARVTFAGVSKTYTDGTRAVLDLDLEIEDGEFVVFVGPSGCGKTSALRMVAGLEEISDGELRIGDRVVNDVEPRKRDVAMVFQNYALYPHMSVYENIAFPLKSQGVPRREVQERVGRTASMLGLEEQLRRRPRNLSGGQRQRVAMGRAIVRQPQVFLMDEPLSNLDAKLRVQMRAEIAGLQRTLGVTTIYVTHDQVEAMTMGDRIAVMRKGVLQQQGPPQVLYDRPANLFVATFVGSPAMNLFRVLVDGRDGRLSYVIGDRAIPVPDAVLSARPRLREYVGRSVALGVRPEHLVDPAGRDPSLVRLRGEVTVVETLGPERLVYVKLPAQPVITEEVLEIARDVDAALIDALEAEHEGHEVVAVARFDAGSRVAPGDVQELVLLPEHLHLFDLDTGESI